MTHDPHSKYQFDEVGGLKLNLGCGNDIRGPLHGAGSGWLNVDLMPQDNERVLHFDMCHIPWGFVDNKFSLIYASHVMEHIPPTIRRGRDILFVIMDEMHRVLKPGGKLVIRVPLGGSDGCWDNPQHYRAWRPSWFQFFEKDREYNYLVDRHWIVESIKIEKGSMTWRAPEFLRIGKSGLPLSAHLAIRLPFLRDRLTKPAEIVAILQKPERD